MKLTSTIATLFAAASLSACGGGDSGHATAAMPTASLTPPASTTTPPASMTTPVATQPAPTTAPSTPSPAATTPAPVMTAPVATANPIDPYTGKPATGTATTSVSGIVVSNVTSGATVMAYAVQPDGSNGADLGVASVTGADGKFSMELTSVPTGMVRFVATGGTFTSEADGSRQVNTATELVTPYVTSDLNFFVITPATQLMSHLITYSAKAGTDLASAYLNNLGVVRNLFGANLFLKGDWSYGINFLKTVPGSAADMNNTYQDMLTGIEQLGVRYDLPSHVAVRILAAEMENQAARTGVDGSGAPINVGKWVNGSFDERQSLTLDDLAAVRNADGTVKVEFGEVVREYPATLLVTLVSAPYYVAACTDSSALAALIARYGDSVRFTFSDPNTKAGTCDYNIRYVGDLKARMVTNNRGK